MHLLCLLSLAVSLAPSAEALSLHRRDTPAVVQFDIERKKAVDLLGKDLLLRRGTVSERILNLDSFYFCNVTLGTPGQELGLVLDTGSSDLWCNVAGSPFCESDPNNCGITGAFNPRLSSSFTFVNDAFNISYADGTGAAGDYASDRIRFGNAIIDDFQFGLGYQSDSPVGVLGIGYPANEAIATRYGVAPYANLPKAMAEAGLINSTAYSLWLNDLDANTGSILFGGVDTGKFHGELQTLPVVRVNGQYIQLVIALTGVAYSSNSGHHSYSTKALPVGALLDSGSTLTYLPNAIVQDIYNDLKVTYDQHTGNAFVPCSIAADNINITYTFSSPSITVGIDELVLDAGNSYFSDGTKACLFGIIPAGSNTVVLGDTFLRSAYVVYDLANNEISLANTHFNSQQSNILEIGTGSDSVPSASLVPNAVATAPVAGVGARIGGPSVTGWTSGATPLAAPTSTAGFWAVGLLWCFFSILTAFKPFFLA